MAETGVFLVLGTVQNARCVFSSTEMLRNSKHQMCGNTLRCPDLHVGGGGGVGHVALAPVDAAVHQCHGGRHGQPYKVVRRRTPVGEAELGGEGQELRAREGAAVVSHRDGMSDRGNGELGVATQPALDVHFP